MARSCFILTDYDAVNACHSREVSRARTQRLVREASGGFPPRLGQGLLVRIKPPASWLPGHGGQVPGNFSVRVSLAGIEPVGFRVKSDLRKSPCFLCLGAREQPERVRAVTGPGSH
jgi:hypothetical protein